MISLRLTLTLVAACVSALATQQPLTEYGCPQPIEEVSKPDFEFENPETNCKYVSQPWIYDTFSKVATDMDAIFSHVSPDAEFRIMGHHPFAGHYKNPRIAYANSLWRLNQCLKDQKVSAKVWGIHGGCDQAWSIQEFYFNATTNQGLPWELTSLWVSRWDENKIIQEARTYVDAGMIIRTLWENELYMNSTDNVYHSEFVPGPAGVPPWMNETDLL